MMGAADCAGEAETEEEEAAAEEAELPMTRRKRDEKDEKSFCVCVTQPTCQTERDVCMCVVCSAQEATCLKGDQLLHNKRQSLIHNRPLCVIHLTA